MSSARNLCGLILAAGASSRMGSDKALLPWPPRVPQDRGPHGQILVREVGVPILRPGIPSPSAPLGDPLSAQTLLSAAILAFQPFTRAIIVVTGNNAESLAPIVNSNHATLLRNPAPERGQFSSLQTGLRELLARGHDGAMITPVDCPPLRTESLQLLCAGFERALHRGLWSVAPENNSKHGHPLLIGRDMIEALLAAPVTGNAREILHANEQRIEYISVPDPLAKAGLNTPADYAAVTAKNSLK